MASQAQIYDQIYAQRQAEFINKQKLANEQYAQRKENEESKKKKSIRALLSPSNKDETKKVRLHHPHTRRQIGEAVRVHYKSDSVMMFELVNHPGKMMRVNATGKVEFAAVRDDTAVFELEALYSGNLYFLCTAYRDADNVAGGRGWYLSMSQQGQLTGNGGKSESSQWIMITEQPPAAAAASDSTTTSPKSTTLTNTVNPVILTDSGTTILNSASTNSGIGLSNSGTDGTYPGHGAGVEVLIRYFKTTSGARFLQQPEYAAAFKLWSCDKLDEMLHRPDWPLVANYYVDYTTSPLPPLRKSVVDQYVSYAELKSYFESGYVVCKNIVPSDRIDSALRLVNYYTSRFVYATNSGSSSLSSPSNSSGGTSVGTNGKNTVGMAGEGLLRLQGNRVVYNGSIKYDVDILSLFYTTPLTHIVQRLIGAGDVRNPTLACIVTTHPTIELLDNPALYNDQWSLDGFSRLDHSPYTMLVGVALTDIVHNGGGYCVHGGSHLVLMEEYKNQVMAGSTLFSDDPKMVKKTDLGQPTQLVMKAGDAFLCSPRTAYLHSLNTTSTPSTIVYFELSHVDHSVLKTAALDSLWVEYKHADYYNESSDEKAAEQRSVSSASVGGVVVGGVSYVSSDSSTVNSVSNSVGSSATNDSAVCKVASAPVAVAVAVAVDTNISTSTANTPPAKPSKPAATTTNINTSSNTSTTSTARTSPFPINGAIKGTPNKSTTTTNTNTNTTNTTLKASATTTNTNNNTTTVTTPKQSKLLMGLLDNTNTTGDVWDSPLHLPDKSSATSTSNSVRKVGGSTAVTTHTNNSSADTTSANVSNSANTTTNATTAASNTNTTSDTDTTHLHYSEIYPEVPTTPVVLNPSDVQVQDVQGSVHSGVSDDSESYPIAQPL